MHLVTTFQTFFETAMAVQRQYLVYELVLVRLTAVTVHRGGEQ